MYHSIRITPSFENIRGDFEACRMPHGLTKWSMATFVPFHATTGKMTMADAIIQRHNSQNNTSQNFPENPSFVVRLSYVKGRT